MVGLNWVIYAPLLLSNGSRCLVLCYTIQYKQLYCTESRLWCSKSLSNRVYIRPLCIWKPKGLNPDWFLLLLQYIHKSDLKREKRCATPFVTLSYPYFKRLMMMQRNTLAKMQDHTTNFSELFGKPDNQSGNHPLGFSLHLLRFFPLDIRVRW